MLHLETEFKEIRKEWKARKKEEEASRKAAEERDRASAQANHEGQSGDPAHAGQAPSYPAGVRPQLPPIGYEPAQPGQVPAQYSQPVQGMGYQPPNGQMGGYPGNYPHSPYGQGQPVYQPRYSPPQPAHGEPKADVKPDPEPQSNNYQ